MGCGISELTRSGEPGAIWWYSSGILGAGAGWRLVRPNGVRGLVRSVLVTVYGACALVRSGYVMHVYAWECYCESCSAVGRGRVCW